MDTKASPPARLLGIDLGSKTMGLAVSDELGITAQGISTLRRKNKRTDLQYLAGILEKYGISEIIVGNPLHMRGGATEGTERTALFAEELRLHFSLPVHLWDERLTTAEAQRLLRDAEVSSRRRAQVVDQMAAVLILQAFMEYRSSSRKRSDQGISS